MPKLTRKDRKKILKLVYKGYTFAELGKMFDVSPDYISKVAASERTKT